MSQMPAAIVYTSLNEISFEELISTIFCFNIRKEVSEFIKIIRRYRTYIVEVQYLEENDFQIGFIFPREEIFVSFKKEFDKVKNEKLN